MSVYIAFDDGPPTMLASTKGWGDFTRWVDSLDEDDNQDLLILCEHGWSEQLPKVLEQLQNADAPDDENVKHSGEELASLLKGESGVAVITS